MKSNDFIFVEGGIPSIHITLHQFVDHDTWSLYLTLHANDILIGTASAKLGTSKCDQETVVAAMQYLKNEYFKVIGSPMRYENGKLAFLAPDNGILMEDRAYLHSDGQEKVNSMNVPEKMPQQLLA
ncbi:hypothetical protein [uncultured Methanomethylovorans sp.]|uniref:hypothetical protein n=1 Tax=uncultured Methanomethylovorans sp. TaxID=183759 RepID=UPI002AA8A3A0|nr:hypothetical protein [uncultured Methanomethylovorans sp.]